MPRFPLFAALAAATIAGATPALAQDYRYPPPPPRDYPAYPDNGYRPDAGQRDAYRRDGDRRDAYERDDDLVVYGRYGPRPEDADSASSRVSYADLDLYYPEDRRELRRRVSNTARYLCDRLGERDSFSSDGDSCRDDATRDALRRVGTIEAHWAPRGTAWVR